MRVGDIAPPAVTAHPLPPGAPIADWPYRPVIALERLPQAAYVWDDPDTDVTWDDVTPERVWDAPFIGAGFTDASCDFHAVDIDPGDVDELYLFPSTSCTVTLDNRSGTYTPWGPDGQLVYWAPGRRMHVWVEAGPGYVPGYLTPTVGTVTTPDPVPLPDQCTFVFKFRLDDLISDSSLAGQWTGLNWLAHASGDAFTFYASTSGSGAELSVSAFSAIGPPGTEQMIAVYVHQSGGTITMVRSIDKGATWQQIAVRTGAPFTLYHSSHNINIGTGDGSFIWRGRIYSVELRTGLDPAAGTVIWRFDADDYPGSGTSYVDPRGRTWTLTTAAAITPKIEGREWLFSGRVTGWILNADDTVTVTAFDGFGALADTLGGKWTPGTAGQTVTQRFAAIVAAAGYTDPVTVEAGNVTLTAPELEADTSPLMALQRVALSDGGIFYGDADGALDYRNRLWRTGRADQPALWAVSDNVCTVPVVVWDPELAADDERLATDVRLVNTAGLVATATLTGSIWATGARYRLTHPDPDQWTTQTEGNTLAGYLLAQQSTPAMALSRFVLYVQDPRQAPDVWTMAVQIRRGDRIEVMHQYPGVDGNPALLDIFAIVLGVAHQITPETWVSDVALSRTVDYRVLELWDRTRFVWDDPDPAATWRF